MHTHELYGRLLPAFLISLSLLLCAGLAPATAADDPADVEEACFFTGGQDVGLHRLDGHSTPYAYVGGTLSGDTHRYWLKFDLSSLPADVDTITGATLTLTAGRKSTLALGVGVGTDDSWDAATLEWDTQPTYSTPGSVTEYSFVGGTRYSWDVTAQVAGEIDAGDPVVSLVLQQVEEGARTGNVWFYTHDIAPSDATRPVLCVRYTRKAGTPPSVLVGDPVQLCEANHKWHAFDLSDLATATDAEDGDLDLQTAGEILTVTSNEPADAEGAGDGNTAEDIQVVGPATVLLRAERDGRGDGRIYTIHFRVTDADGESVEATAEVHVPHTCGFWDGVAALATSGAKGKAVGKQR